MRSAVAVRAMEIQIAAVLKLTRFMVLPPFVVLPMIQFVKSRLLKNAPNDAESQAVFLKKFGGTAAAHEARPPPLL
jgi:uncharacterized membrane protein YadS